MEGTWWAVETRQSLKGAVDLPGELRAAGLIVALSAPFGRATYMADRAEQARPSPAATTASGADNVSQNRWIDEIWGRKECRWAGLSVHLVGFPGVR